MSKAFVKESEDDDEGLDDREGG
ncbi:MAG: hypothetical protein RL539_19, partial [Pseudomonadota bacterium]